MLGGVPVSRLLPGNTGMADLIVAASTEINTEDDRAFFARTLSEVI